MVAAVSNEQDQRLPKPITASPRKPRGKQVPSRYLSPSPSSSSTSTSTTTTNSSSSSSFSSFVRRFPSPLLPRAANSTSGSSISSFAPPKRSQSVDRRRVSISPNPCDVSAASKMLVTSTRSLSVSFQGETFSLPVSKAKTATSNGGRKVTPERRRPANMGENIKPSDQHKRWPARARGGSLIDNLSRSLNLGDNANAGEKLAGEIQSERRFSLDLGKKESNPLVETLSAGDLTASDSDSVSSGSNDLNRKLTKNPQKLVDSARFWQETSSRLRRLQDSSSSPLSSSPSSRFSKGLSLSSKRNSDGSSSSPITLSRAPSPSRALSSPSKIRGPSDSSPSILSFSIDLRRGKIGEEKIIDAHSLRLLYNHYLQWRFVNARCDAASMAQSVAAERQLWNAWVKISELRHTVTLKRIKLLLLTQKLKLSSILKGQICDLEDWSLIDRDHLGSLEGATEALKASTLRLPVVGNAVVDLKELKDVIVSAVDVMQSMASSICSVSGKLEETDHLMAELAILTANERVLLGHCKEFLSIVIALQVTYCSLRAHIIQVNLN